MADNTGASTTGKSYLPLYNDAQAMVITRPGDRALKGKLSYIDGIQTGNPDWECDTMTIRVRHTPYGMVNGEVYLEMLTFDGADLEIPIDKVYPTSSVALDEIGARQLINQLSAAFNIEHKLPVNQRSVLTKVFTRRVKKNDEEEEESQQQTR